MAEKNLKNKKNQKEDAADFTKGPIVPKMLNFMIPILGALILQAMYGMVDILVVGWFGTDESISAVSTGSSIVQMVTFILTSLAMGVTVLMGQYIGEKNEKRLNNVIGGAIVTFLAIGVVMTIVMLTLSRPIAELMQAPAAALDKTVVYLHICGGGIIFIIGYNLISSIFRGLGNSRLPLVFVGIACVVNIVGDLLFVAVFHWDVAGAAIATVLAQAVSLILSLLMCRKMDLPFKLTRENLTFNPEVGRFLKLGLPIAFQEFLTQLSFMALLAFINGMGTTDAIQLASSSGYGVANKLVNLVMLIPSSLMQSMSSFVAQNVGAGNEKRCRKALGYGILIGVCIGVFVFLAIFFKGILLTSLFTSDAVYQLKAYEYLKGFCLEAVVTAIMFSFVGYYNGHNQTFFVMIQGLGQSFLVRLPMAFLMSRAFPDTLFYVGLSAPSATIFGIILNVSFFIWFTKKLKAKEAKL